MNSYFENFNEEINSIINRSNKDNSTVLFKIEKSKEINIKSFNNIFVDSFAETFFNVNLCLISAEGYLAHGASNKLHLPDVITRLSQSLENILKAGKGHKIAKGVSINELNTQHVNNLQNTEYSECRIEELKVFIKKLFEDIPYALKEELDFKFFLRSRYDLILSGNSRGGQSNSDVYTTVLEIKICLKSNEYESILLSEVFKYKHSEEKEESYSYILNKIVRVSSTLLEAQKFEKLSAKEVSPDLVLVSEGLVNYLFGRILLESDPVNFLTGLPRKNGFLKKLNFKLKESNIGKYPFCVKQTMDLPLIEITDLEKQVNSPTISDHSISQLIFSIQKNFPQKKVLLLCGKKTETNETKGGLELSPASAFFIKEKEVYSVDLSLVILKRIKEINLLGERESSLFTSTKGNIILDLPKYALVNISSEDIELL